MPILRIFHCWLFSTVKSFFQHCKQTGCLQKCSVLYFMAVLCHHPNAEEKTNGQKLNLFLLKRFSPCSWVVWGNSYSNTSKLIQNQLLCLSSSIVLNLQRCCSEQEQWLLQSSTSTQCFHLETWKGNPGIIRVIFWGFFFPKELNCSVKTFLLQFPLPEIPVLSCATLMV